MSGDAVQLSSMYGGWENFKPLLHPIPVNRIFKIVGVDIIGLPPTTQGNRYVVGLEDFLSKSEVATDSVSYLWEEVVPLFGVPEALLSDRGMNLLSHLYKLRWESISSTRPPTIGGVVV